jgi:hypothetical protein
VTWLWALLALGGVAGWTSACSLGHNPDLPDVQVGDGDDSGFTSGSPDGGDGDALASGGAGAAGGGGAEGGLGGGGLGGVPEGQPEETP